MLGFEPWYGSFSVLEALVPTTKHAIACFGERVPCRGSVWHPLSGYSYGGLRTFMQKRPTMPDSPHASARFSLFAGR